MLFSTTSLFFLLPLLFSSGTLATPVGQESAVSPPKPAPYPTKVIAGVTVIDTPIVRAAQEYARKHLDDMGYNHVIRSWLYSVIISQKVTKTFGAVDAEIQALGAILHDLGWDNTGELISKDKRFEVDGAIAARNWIEAQRKNGTADGWDSRRTQLVWDSIALHTTPSIAQFKEPEVALVGVGIVSDFQGPNTDPTKTLTWDEFNTVIKSYPRHDLAGGIRRIICNFAKTKPETTYGE